MSEEQTPLERLTEALDNGQQGDPRDLAAVMRDLDARAPKHDPHTEDGASPVTLSKVK